MTVRSKSLFVFAFSPWTARFVSQSANFVDSQHCLWSPLLFYCTIKLLPGTWPVALLRLNWFCLLLLCCALHGNASIGKVFIKGIAVAFIRICLMHHIVTIRRCDCRRGVDSWMDLSTASTHDLKIQAITAPPLICRFQKSPQHPLSLFQPACLHQPFPDNGF
jgi:hypothetical protein